MPRKERKRKKKQLCIVHYIGSKVVTLAKVHLQSTLMSATLVADPYRDSTIPGRSFDQS